MASVSLTMSKVRVPIKCRCGRQTSAVITKPTVNSKQTGVTTCEHCLSQIEYEISRDNSKDVDVGIGLHAKLNTGVQVKSQMLTISKDLEALMGK